MKTLSKLFALACAALTTQGAMAQTAEQTFQQFMAKNPTFAYKIGSRAFS